MSARLASKAAVVVGGSSGFGEAIARRFVAEGARVMTAARGEEKLRKVAAEIGAEAFACDATDWGQLRSLAETAQATLAGLDVAAGGSLRRLPRADDVLRSIQAAAVRAKER